MQGTICKGIVDTYSDRDAYKFGIKIVVENDVKM